MKKSIIAIKKNVDIVRNADKKYRNLQKHLDKNTLGFPSTWSGVEIRILKTMFTPDEADAALNLTHKFELLGNIYERATLRGLPKSKLKLHLAEMETKGCIYTKKRDNEKYYALAPFIIGMLEMQVKHLTAGYYLDSTEYITKKYALEYLSTEVPQFRVIPIEKSITPEHKIATYDEIIDILEKSKDKITVTECVCKKGKDLIGEQCKVTDRRRVCLQLREYSDTHSKQKWGEPISKEEALEILKQSQEDGLVLQSHNQQEPQSICACCKCCCGPLNIIGTFPRPADFVASNYYAEYNSKSCIGCGICEKRCQMDAVKQENKKAVFDIRRCIGCGLCVPTCKTQSIKLIQKTKEIVPPQTKEEHYDIIMNNKKSKLGKLVLGAKAIMNLKV